MRQIDSLGRVVIPAHIRKELGLSENDCVVFSAENGRVVMTPANGRRCSCCGRTDEPIYTVDDLHLCDTCYKKFSIEHLGAKGMTDLQKQK